MEALLVVDTKEARVLSESSTSKRKVGLFVPIPTFDHPFHILTNSVVPEWNVYFVEAPSPA